MKKTNLIQANSVPTTLNIVSEAMIDIFAADDKDSLKKFKIRAYNGGQMSLGYWTHPVVVEMGGLTVVGKNTPILKDHDQGKVCGHSTAIVAGQSTLDIEGEFSGTGPDAQEVIANAANGFKWQASVGIQTKQVLFVEEDEIAVVNGSTHKGPLYVARKSVLKEVSIVAVGADEKGTSVQIAASAGQPTKEVHTMKFEKWLEAKDKDLAKLTEAEIAELKAQWEAEIAANGDPAKADDPTPDADPAPGTDPTKAADPANVQADASVDPGVAQVRATMAAEYKRIDKLTKICGANHGDVLAQAIEGGWSEDKTELTVLRAARPTAPNVITGSDNVMTPQTIQAIGCVNGGMSGRGLEANFSEQELDIASKHKGLGIQDYFRIIAAAEGIELPRMTSSGSEFIRAAFSTVSLPGLLGAVANKSLLEGYSYVEQTWRAVCKIASVKNFQLHTRYRMTDDFKFELVGPDGELKHGKLGQQTFTNQADTRGILFSLTRQQIINDDLNAFLTMPVRIGRGAGEAIAEAVWTLVLSNPSSFFATGNSNYDEGTDTPLSVASLTLAEILFLTQTKTNGRPLGIAPTILLVPPALKVLAEQLMKSIELVGQGADAAPVAASNPHAGKYTVETSAYLQNATITGYSALAWYLFADPNVLAAFEVAFLNGVDEPTVEQADANFNTLGVQFRGYIDFGVKEQDPKGAVKMKGEA